MIYNSENWGTINMTQRKHKPIIKGDWKPWFAWFPIKTDDGIVWLKPMYRRRVCAYVYNDIVTYYQYGTIFDILKDG